MTGITVYTIRALKNRRAPLARAFIPPLTIYAHHKCLFVYMIRSATLATAMQFFTACILIECYDVHHGYWRLAAAAFNVTRHGSDK